MNITPEQINELKPNEIFVFGSNMQGNHAGGAAKFAVIHFGAEMGNPIGLQGQSYAIPTLYTPGYREDGSNRLPIEEIGKYVNQLLQFANEHPEMHFLVTPIGCGIAGFTESEIAPLFKNAINMENISLPKTFIPYLSNNGIINENSLVSLIKESIFKQLKEGDRHRPGYYAEYARKRKAEGKPADRHRPGYYQEYAKTHPEWAAKHPELLGNNDIESTKEPKPKKKKVKKTKRYYMPCHIPYFDEDDYEAVDRIWNDDIWNDLRDGEVGDFYPGDN